MPDFDAAVWTTGWVVAALVIAIVAVLVLVLIGLASRIRRQTSALLEALAATRDATTPLWSVEGTVIALGGAVQEARRARGREGDTPP